MFLYLNLCCEPVFQKRRPDNITYGKLNERIIIYTFDKVSLVNTKYFDIISGHVQLKRIKNNIYFEPQMWNDKFCFVLFFVKNQNLFVCYGTNVTVKHTRGKRHFQFFQFFGERTTVLWGKWMFLKTLISSKFLKNVKNTPQWGHIFLSKNILKYFC